MTDEQLQIAIDKTLAMAMSVEGGYKHAKFRDDAHAHLKDLFKIQALRAGLPTQVGLIRPGSYQEIK
jgi:thiamine phosphate synthase YjbQ (UPF0047 family)